MAEDKPKKKKIPAPRHVHNKENVSTTEVKGPTKKIKVTNYKCSICGKFMGNKVEEV